MDRLTINATAIAIQANVTPNLSGAPGTGKSAATAGITNALRKGTGKRWPFVTMTASDHNPEDFTGVFSADHERGYVRLLPLEWAHALSKDVLGDDPAVLFLDEFNDDPAKQAPMQKIAHGNYEPETGLVRRYVGDKELGLNVRVVMAMNPPDIATSGQAPRPPVANRLCTLDVVPNVAAFLEGAIAGFPTPDIPILPDDWADGIPQARAMVVGFLHARPELAHKVPRDDQGNLEETKACGSWPSYRSWENAWKLLAACQSVNAPPELEFVLVKGCVGEGAALEFAEYRRNLDLPNPEDLLIKPDKVIETMKKAEGRTDIIYATLASVVSAVLNRNTPTRWNAGISVCNRAHDHGDAAIATISAETLCKHRPKGLKDKDITKDILIFADLLKKADIWNVQA